GVCQILAKSCHSNPGSPMPAASVTQDRTSSGRVETTRTTNPPPQSCPTRSTGPSRRSSCAASHAAYSSIVAPNPSGRTPSNPGSDRAALPGRSSAASRLFQTAEVSGTPWTKTAVTAPYCHSGEGSSRGNDANRCPKAPAQNDSNCDMLPPSRAVWKADRSGRYAADRDADRICEPPDCELGGHARLAILARRKAPERAASCSVASWMMIG